MSISLLWHCNHIFATAIPTYTIICLNPYVQGEYTYDNAARLVKNRGPITAKVTASGSHNRYCTKSKAGEDDCSVDVSLVAWKFAGDKGTVHGMIEEQYKDGSGGLKVDVDCMVRNDKEAIVGGKVKEASDAHPVGKAKARRAYIKVVDGTDGGEDYVSNVYFDDGINSHCTTDGLNDKLVITKMNVIEPLVVSVCSKRNGDWQKCLEKAKTEQAIAIE